VYAFYLSVESYEGDGYQVLQRSRRAMEGTIMQLLEHFHFGHPLFAHATPKSFDYCHLTRLLLEQI